MRILVPIQKNNKKTEIKLGTTGSDAWSGYCVYKNRPFSDPEFHGNGNVPSIVRYRGGGPGHKNQFKSKNSYLASHCFTLFPSFNPCSLRDGIL